MESTPTTKAARQARIAELIRTEPIRTQTELGERLAVLGVRVTQPTLSKDLSELGAVRSRQGEHLIYGLPSEQRPADAPRRRLARLASELVTSVEGFAHFTVLKTPPGAAQLLASALDQVSGQTVAGTIAGDDTVLVIHRTATGGAAYATEILALTTSREATDD